MVFGHTNHLDGVLVTKRSFISWSMCWHVLLLLVENDTGLGGASLSFLVGVSVHWNAFKVSLQCFFRPIHTVGLLRIFIFVEFPDFLNLRIMIQFLWFLYLGDLFREFEIYLVSWVKVMRESVWSRLFYSNVIFFSHNYKDIIPFLCFIHCCLQLHVML